MQTPRTKKLSLQSHRIQGLIINKSPLFSYRPTKNKWNLKLKTQNHLKYFQKINI